MPRTAAALLVVALAGLAYAGAQEQATHQPGDTLSATCAGQWTAVSTSPTAIQATCAEVAPPPEPPTGLRIVVDEQSVADFDSTSMLLATGQRVLFVDRSVGSNINDGLSCLASPYESAANACKRTQHVVPEFSNAPETWHGTYPRGLIEFWSHNAQIPPYMGCAAGETEVACFARFLDERPGAYDTALFMPSYLLETTADAYVYTMLTLRARHPSLVLALATSSLPRDAAPHLEAFNQAVRGYAEEYELPLLDVARIVSHTQAGAPCFDNADGVPYVVNGRVLEDFPDDGQAVPAICQHYTREVRGGHLGNPDVGKIRVAKALWVLIARIAEARG